MVVMCSKFEHSPLLVIADDLTGALDTGVQFSKSGAKTKILVLHDFYKTVFPLDFDVIVIDTETRHLDSQKAYSVIKDLAVSAVKSGIRYFYKKTDSLLRGNIGAELSALMDGAGKEKLFFFPSFPQIGRTVRNGVLYINDIPVSDAEVAKDLFNPVPSSCVSTIIGLQTEKEVFINKDNLSSSGIYVFDSETEEEMQSKAQTIGKDNILLSAGCAGFAGVLCRILGFTDIKDYGCDDLDGNFLVISGTPNAVTLSQLDFAEKKGMVRILLPQEFKDREEVKDEKIKEFATLVTDCLNEKGWVAVDVGKAETSLTHEKEISSLEIKRRIISKNIGRLAKCIFDNNIDSTTLLVGGDILFAALNAMNIEVIIPECEIQPGVVLMEMEYRNKKYKVATKSGGFGNENLISNLYKRTKESV